MAYPKGYIELNEERDYPLLRCVLDSGFIAHRQLFEFLVASYHEHSRESFNWRVKRLVEHRFLIRHNVPAFGRNYVYSVSREGAHHLCSKPECASVAIAWLNLKQDSERILHAVELNELRLILQRAGLLARWMSALEVRSRNELTEYGYAKDYDAIVTLRVVGKETQVALEYERQPKGSKRYAQIARAIESERRVTKFFYLVPDYKLLWFVQGYFAKTARRIYFGTAEEFKRDLLEMKVIDGRLNFSTFREAFL